MGVEGKCAAGMHKNVKAGKDQGFNQVGIQWAGSWDRVDVYGYVYVYLKSKPASRDGFGWTCLRDQSGILCLLEGNAMASPQTEANIFRTKDVLRVRTIMCLAATTSRNCEIKGKQEAKLSKTLKRNSFGNGLIIQ